MEVDTEDEVLQVLARGGSMDYEQWPSLLPRLLVRLEKIIDEDFPKPSTTSQDASVPASQVTTQDLSASQPSTQSSSSTSLNKENAIPNIRTATLTPQIRVLADSVTSTLKSLFSTHPPHTIQRLAELLVNPREHYRSLTSYLHALDRVVHVSSGAHIFPLPPAIPDPAAAASVLSNGKLPGGADPLSISWGNPVGGALGSDESLGGALLTPISWLTKANGTHSPLEGEVKTESTETIDGPNGPGGVETVTVSINGISSPRETKDGVIESTAAALRAEGGVTQGELLRQEQKAGVVPAHQLKDDDDDIPHARGPEEVGMEDLGPQDGTNSHSRGSNIALHGINVEAAVGRRVEVAKEEGDVSKGEDESDVDMEEGGKTPKRGAEEEKSGVDKRVKEDEGKGDEEEKEAVLVDVDGRTEDEPKVGEKGETKGADAIDTSSIP